MPELTINRILVGAERFTAADRQNTADAIGVMRQIFLGIGLHLRIELFRMSVAEAGRFVHITGFADVVALTHRVQAGPVGTIDMFVVRTMSGTGVGWSPIGGPCDKSTKGATGVAVSLIGANAAFRGNTFAHEVGHYLGLSHASCSDPALTTNFIRGGGCSSEANVGISPAQASAMLAHCSIRP
ncbi:MULTISPECIES: zinc-dependent metalloprotease family protein [Microbacterium]|uniref:zinc-dependent metalloprotease family protein n=2 Tax=Microbacterium TaxID=33882 RepID=UPI0019C3E674|nr:zinc-dependent metalloprotease family protein [Microbacterium sp.]MBD3758854.1 hypothetical protein [Microbacterium sp.]